MAVSYTHLDVYKRQLHQWLVGGDSFDGPQVGGAIQRL